MKCALLNKILTCLVFISAISSCANSEQKPLTKESSKIETVEKIPPGLASQLPAPPEGFNWQLYQDAAFLLPRGWFEHAKISNENGFPLYVYGASPTDFTDKNMFEMGLTIQIIRGSQKAKGIEAKKMAVVYLKAFLAAHTKEEILMLEKSTKGDFERTYFRYRDAPSGLKPIIVHKFIMANNITDAVHVFTFESPEDAWEINWKKYGTPILSKVNLIAVASKP